MIYASDLDRTLIYSEAFLNMHPCESEMVLVDEAKMNSYMSTDVIGKLNRIINETNTMFLPVTTRNIEQYKRITIPGVNPEYAITSNGGNILHNGEKLSEWEDIVSSSFDERELESVASKIDRLPGVNYDTKIVDGVFVFTKTDNIEEANKALIKLKDEHTRYKFIVEKSKVYAIPKFVTKYNALEWLMKKLGRKYLVVSGDSEFDISMLSKANVAIIPSHNTIDQFGKSMIGYYVECDEYANSPLKTMDIVNMLSKEKSLHGTGSVKQRHSGEGTAQLCSRN